MSVSGPAEDPGRCGGRGLAEPRRVWDSDRVVLLLDGRLELDEDLFELRRDGTRVPLEPQAYDVLLHLVRHHERVVPKEELMDAVWGGRFVSETAVTSRIKQVRRALGDDGRAQRLVRTLHGRGYRFVADVTSSAVTWPATPVTPAGPATAPAPRPPVRYTVSDGLHVAYQVTGQTDSSTDVVLISGFVSHLELDWEDPRHALFLDGLGSAGRLIRFDKRGTGMSDRPSGVPDLETRMHDVLAVMDAVGSEQAVVCGYSEGGPMAMLLAAMHPERVSGLVLYGTYARRTSAEDYPWAQTPEVWAAYTDRLVRQWDWEADLRMRCPSGDAAMQQWWARRMRAAATPGTVRALMDMNSLVDVRDVLGGLTIPTLVVHRLGDPMFSVDEARYLARRIPGAELVLLEGRDHFVSGNPAQLLEVIEPFVRAVGAEERRTALAAVLASSPADEGVSSALVRNRGRIGRTVDGRPLALYDGPATAARAAVRLLGSADSRPALGLTISDVPTDDRPCTGPGIDEALRLADRARPGELLVGAAASTLLACSGIDLEPGGDGVSRAVLP